jgi:leucyl-tRNA synthetase
MFGAPPESDFNFEENMLTSMNQYIEKVIKLGDKITQSKVKINGSRYDIQS